MAQLIIGLGNRGGEYANTRHNVGWMCLDELEHRGKFGRERREGPAKIRDGNVEGFDIITARPQTYMNLSGHAGVHLTNRLGTPPPDVIVVYDEADLPLGRLRLRRGGTAGGHRGVQSLIDSWRLQDFIRVRIGIGRPHGEGDLIEHVLDRFDPGEREVVRTAVSRAADAVIAIIRDGLEVAMTQFNRAAAG
mgnify:CR=1 FL=1